MNCSLPKPIQVARAGLRRAPLLLALWLAAAASAAWAQSTNRAPSRPEFSKFSLITERNIFNPRRYAQSKGRPTAPASRADYLTLVGVMSYERGTFAFFDGTSSDYRKVTKLSETVAGFTVKEIGNSSVKLSSGTNDFQVKLGTQIRRGSDGSWQMTSSSGGAPITVASSAGASGRGGRVSAPTESGTATVASESAPETEEQPATAEPATDSASPDSGAASTDDPVLKKLMQRREQELNR
jgi:hypothetical protein